MRLPHPCASLNSRHASAAATTLPRPECRARHATMVDVTRAWRASKGWRDEARKAASCKA
eukprot:2179788-Prymnesium_polylepis.1